MAQQYGNGSNISVKVAGPFGNAGSSIKLTNITIPAADWKGAISPYSQVVAVDGISMNSMVELQPTEAQVEKLRQYGIALTTDNNEGVVTVYAIGDKPTEDYVIQATLVEVTA